MCSLYVARGSCQASGKERLATLVFSGHGGPKIFGMGDLTKPPNYPELNSSGPDVVVLLINLTEGS